MKKALLIYGKNIGKEVFQASLGEEKYAKNSKKKAAAVKCQWREVIVDKANSLAQCPNGFRISSHLQETIAYLGSDYVFDAAAAGR